MYKRQEYAKEHGAILYYDINFRASHQNEIMKITPNLIENLEMADFVLMRSTEVDEMCIRDRMQTAALCAILPV